MDNLCVCCGLPIPEGRQVCPDCENHGKNERELVEVVRCKDCKHWNSVDERIKHMSILPLKEREG